MVISQAASGASECTQWVQRNHSMGADRIENICIYKVSAAGVPWTPRILAQQSILQPQCWPSLRCRTGLSQRLGPLWFKGEDEDVSHIFILGQPEAGSGLCQAWHTVRHQVEFRQWEVRGCGGRAPFSIRSVYSSASPLTPSNLRHPCFEP